MNRPDATFFEGVAIDLDGTLLVGESLSERNRAAVAAAAESGLAVILATARWRQMALRIAEACGISGPLIACSGAQVHDPEIGSDLFDRRLPVPFVEALYTLCDEHRCIATVTVDDETLLKLDGDPDMSQMPPELRHVRSLRETGLVRPRVAVVQGSSVYRMVHDSLAPGWRNDVHFADSVGPSGKTMLTLTAAGADKGRALEVACERLGIAPGRVIAFGDSDNDIPMFRTAGWAVAMGQADEATRAAANEVTGTNVEDGVAQVLEVLTAERRGTA